eukprot:scaffold7504_cov121-Isochrysis_galbana.AAC.11
MNWHPQCTVSIISHHIIIRPACGSENPLFCLRPSLLAASHSHAASATPFTARARCHPHCQHGYTDTCRKIWLYSVLVFINIFI